MRSIYNSEQRKDWKLPHVVWGLRVGLRWRPVLGGDGINLDWTGTRRCDGDGGHGELDWRGEELNKGGGGSKGRYGAGWQAGWPPHQRHPSLPTHGQACHIT